MKRLILTICLTFALLSMNAQEKKVYDENINQMEQIDAAVKKASAESKYVVCQVGGNWCPWCLRFADFIVKDSTINKCVTDNFVYIHVNYPGRKAQTDSKKAEITAQAMARLGNCGRFGFPVLVVLDDKGNVIHIQDSSFLEEGKGYNAEKVLRFLQTWTPKAVIGK